MMIIVRMGSNSSRKECFKRRIDGSCETTNRFNGGDSFYLLYIEIVVGCILSCLFINRDSSLSHISFKLWRILRIRLLNTSLEEL